MDLELGNAPGAAVAARCPRSRRPSRRRAPRPAAPDRAAPSRWLLLGLMAALAAPGCGHRAAIQFASDPKPPSVRVLRPPVRNIVREVGQPSFIEAYEHTSIFAKPAGFIKEWKVDIGDKVKKDQPLAYLFVPELEEDFLTKGAAVVLDAERVVLAQKVVEVATADVTAADARLKEAKAILDKFEAEVHRWDAEVERLQREVDRGVVDARILMESRNQLKASIAVRDQAVATIKRADAELLSRRAALSKAEVDVKVAMADLKVAESEERRLKAWVGYLTLTAPFDGVVTGRNANTFDFVLPSTGDPSAQTLGQGSYHNAPGGSAAPIYVVDRTDIVRVFLDVPEGDANYVGVGTKATVLVKGYRDEPIPAKVTRTSWALNMKSRTLRVEIDLDNPGSRLLPGMYAYAKVIIERPGARALPAEALSYYEDKAYCWTLEDGHAVRTQVMTGVSDGEWVEVSNRINPAAGKGEDPWVPIDGQEQILVGDLSLLADGVPVQIEPAAGTKLASESPAPEHRGPATPPTPPRTVDASDSGTGAARSEL